MILPRRIVKHLLGYVEFVILDGKHNNKYFENQLKQDLTGFRDFLTIMEPLNDDVNIPERYHLICRVTYKMILTIQGISPDQ